jgi:Flp pilus assembly protein TadG
MNIRAFARGIAVSRARHSVAAQAQRNKRGSVLNALARLLRHDEGGPLVEFGFVLPMMMVVVTGTFAFGLALNTDLVLTQATGAGAQYLQTIRTSTSDPCADTLTAIENAAPSLKSANIGISLTIPGASGAYTSSSCTGAATYLKAARGEAVTVGTTYPCSLLIYTLPFGSQIGKSCTLSAQVTEYEY